MSNTKKTSSRTPILPIISPNDYKLILPPPPPLPQTLPSRNKTRSNKPPVSSHPKAPPNIPMARIKQFIKKMQKKGKRNGPVNYMSYYYILQIAYFMVTKKYQTKCMVTHKENELNYIQINTDDEYSLDNINLILDLKDIANQMMDCIHNGENLICIPIMLYSQYSNIGHINLLIYRPHQKTIERFEPQWLPPDMTPQQIIENNQRIDTILKHIFESHIRIHLGEYTPTYYSPELLCPANKRYKGFQTIEESYFTPENATVGFCAMWSLFVMELMFLNPEMETREVMDTAIRFMRNNPVYVKEVIRGYVLEMEGLLDTFMKEIDQPKGFKYSDINTLYEMMDKHLEIKKHASEYLGKKATRTRTKTRTGTGGQRKTQCQRKPKPKHKNKKEK